jgi:hypothetical protein
MDATQNVHLNQSKPTGKTKRKLVTGICCFINLLPACCAEKRIKEVDELWRGYCWANAKRLGPKAHSERIIHHCP